jgi:hypothetical protein
LHLNKDHADQYSASDPKQTRLHHFFKTTDDRPLKRQRGSEFTASDKELADRKLIDWIVNHSQPFSVVEQSDFVQYSAILQPEYSVSSRNTVRNKILARWQIEKNRVRAKLKADLSGSRCGLTTDMWTSAAKRGYMVVTIHYIDSEWEMKSLIIAFIRVQYPHTGDNLRCTSSMLIFGV